jgi:hypothetical protein
MLALTTCGPVSRAARSKRMKMWLKAHRTEQTRDFNEL